MSEVRERTEREEREEEGRGQTEVRILPQLLSHSRSPLGQSLESGQLGPPRLFCVNNTRDFHSHGARCAIKHPLECFCHCIL